MIQIANLFRAKPGIAAVDKFPAGLVEAQGIIDVLQKKVASTIENLLVISQLPVGVKGYLDGFFLLFL